MKTITVRLSNDAFSKLGDRAVTKRFTIEDYAGHILTEAVEGKPAPKTLVDIIEGKPAPKTLVDIIEESGETARTTFHGTFGL